MKTERKSILESCQLSWYLKTVKLSFVYNVNSLETQITERFFFFNCNLLLCEKFKWQVNKLISGIFEAIFKIYHRVSIFSAQFLRLSTLKCRMQINIWPPTIYVHYNCYFKILKCLLNQVYNQRKFRICPDGFITVDFIIFPLKIENL